MSDENQTEIVATKVPAWYWLAAIAALLFEGYGAYLFGNSLSLDPATLTLDQRVIHDATPQWMSIVWGIAIAAGLIGAIGLVLRRRFAEPALLLSAAAVAVQIFGIILIQQLREVTPEGQLTLQVIILLIAYSFWQTAKLAQRRGWLR